MLWGGVGCVVLCCVVLCVCVVLCFVLCGVVLCGVCVCVCVLVFWGSCLLKEDGCKIVTALSLSLKFCFSFRFESWPFWGIKGNWVQNHEQ